MILLYKNLINLRLKKSGGFIFAQFDYLKLNFYNENFVLDLKVRLKPLMLILAFCFILYIFTNIMIVEKNLNKAIRVSALF